MFNKRRVLTYIFVIFIFLMLTLSPTSVEVEIVGWNVTTSRNTSYYISRNISSTILPLNFCADEVFLVVLVESAPDHFEARSAIRNSWGSNRQLHDKNISVYFLLGETKNSSLQRDILSESKDHQDIIQENFMDSYNNLTLKSISLMKLASMHCSDTTKFVMKVDDDVFVNTEQLLNILTSHKDSSNLILGRKICGAWAIRDPLNKWYSPRYMYEDKKYPDYVSGTAYVITIDVAEKLYAAALTTPIFHLEDIYLTGICAKKAGVTVEGNYMFIYRQQKIDPCLMKMGLTFHEFNSTSLLNIYKILKDESLNEKCKHYKEKVYKGACNKAKVKRRRRRLNY